MKPWQIDRNKAIINVQATFPEDKEIVKILNGCCFEPFKSDWRKWQNEGYNLTISTDKRILIKDKAQKQLRISDILVKAEIEEVLQRSDNFLFDCDDCSIVILGKGRTFREYRFINSVWVPEILRVKPLERLRLLVKNIDSDFINKGNYYIGKICSKINSQYPELLKQLLETIPRHTEEIIE